MIVSSDNVDGLKFRLFGKVMAATVQFALRTRRSATKEGHESSHCPSANRNWEVKEIDRPEPGENQVLIKIRASGMCYTDVHQARGELPGDFPRTLGHEPVGEIMAVGPGVTARKTDDRVGVPWVQHTCGRCEWCARSKPMFCEKSIGTGVEMSGGHAEYMVAYADATMLLPDGLDYEQAAPLFCAGYTVWSGLRWAQPQPSERLAVVGVGGLGHLAVQYAKAAGSSTWRGRDCAGWERFGGGWRRGCDPRHEQFGGCDGRQHRGAAS